MVSALAGKAGHSLPSERKLGENSGMSGRKMTGGVDWQRIGSALWASLMFRFTLDTSLKAVGDRILIPTKPAQTVPILWVK